jgi:GxxExxY protein
VGAAIEVHRRLGPGLLESAYENCLCRELSLRGISLQRQVDLPVHYRGLEVDCGYRLEAEFTESSMDDVTSVSSVPLW